MAQEVHCLTLRVYSIHHYEGILILLIYSINIQINIFLSFLYYKEILCVLKKARGITCSHGKTATGIQNDSNDFLILDFTIKEAPAKNL